MVSIKIGDLSRYDMLTDLSKDEQQVRGGFYEEWQTTGYPIQYFLDGYTAGDYDLKIVTENDKKYLLFTLNSLFRGTPGATTGKPGIGIYALA